MNVGNGSVRKLGPAGHELPLGSQANGVVPVAFPQALAVAADGSVLIAASGFSAFTPNIASVSRLVQRIAPDGTLTTVAGRLNEAWTQDGPAADARFRDPAGICVGPQGRIVLTEAATSAIRQMDAAGNVSTLAGGSGDGAIDGPADAARFFGPGDIVATPAGQLMVADTSNARLRGIDAAGRVSTLALRTPAGEPFSLGRSVGSIATDGRGTVYETPNSAPRSASSTRSTWPPAKRGP